MTDLHEAVFRWPHEAQSVILTGTFDQWSRSRHLTKGPSGFEGTVRVPWAAKVAYKFVVDGRWATTDQAATERDSIGNLNNVYYAPTKPEIPTIINELPMVTVVPPHRAQVKNLELSLPVEETESRENGTPVVPLFQQQIPLPQPTQEIPPQSEPAPEPTIAESETLAHAEPEAFFAQTTTEPEIVSPETEPVPEPEVASPEPEVALTPEPAATASKITMPIVPVNDLALSSGSPVSTPPATEGNDASTHAPVINSPRKPSSGSIPIVASETGIKLNGTKDTPTLNGKKESTVTNGTPKLNGINGTHSRNASAALPSPPTTPKKYTSISSRSESPTSTSKFDSTRSKKKRSSFIHRVKTLFTPEKEKVKK